MPQFIHALAALQRGVQTAKSNGVDLSRWRAQITYMVGRLGAEPEFKQQAQERAIELTTQDIRWAEMVLYQRIQPLVKQTGLSIKMLLCSLRIDNEGQEKRCFHIEQSTGTDCVYTIPPTFFLELFQSEADRMQPNVEGASTVPSQVMHKLMQIPYFLESYEANGMAAERFSFHPAFLTGLSDVNSAYRRTLDIIRTCR